MASALSLSSAKASGLPTSACDTDFARRCDCIIASPEAPTWVALVLPERTASSVDSSRPIVPSASRVQSTFCWVPAGRWPIRGMPVPATAAGVSIAASMSCSGASSEGATAVKMEFSPSSWLGWALMWWPLSGPRSAMPPSTV